MSENFCNVSLGDYDGDAAQFYNEKLVTARKAHVCYECQEPIAKGQQHERVTGKWDGDIRTYRFCAGCWEILHEFSEDGAMCFGVTWDTFRDEWNAGATLQGCLNRLTSIDAKQLMARQWRKFKGLPA